jgi:hypothetical protein
MAARGSRRRTWVGGSSLLRLGREAFWQRVWRRERTPIGWALDEVEAPNWSCALQAHHAPAGVRTGRRAAPGSHLR